MLLLAVSRRTLDQMSEIRKTTIRQRKSLLSTAQETNFDGPYTYLNALKHLSVKAEVIELQLFLRIFLCNSRRTFFVDKWFWGFSLSSEVILSGVVLRSFLTIRCKVRLSLSDKFSFAESFSFLFQRQSLPLRQCLLKNQTFGQS